MKLYVNSMLSSFEFKFTLDDWQSAMRDVGRKMKCHAILHRLSSLSPVVPFDTRCSGMSSMLKRFVRIRDELEEVANTDGWRFRLPAHCYLEINTASLRVIFPKPT